jgi:hypothetical protein
VRSGHIRPAEAQRRHALLHRPPGRWKAEILEMDLAGIGRSPTAFCACELRSPAQFSEAGFFAFNRRYVGSPRAAFSVAAKQSRQEPLSRKLGRLRRYRRFDPVCSSGESDEL